jgi:NAD(P) transhydrogenase subunit alpha
MFVGIPLETKSGESRVSQSPDTLKKLLKKGVKIKIEKSAGLQAGFADKDYAMDGVEIVDSKASVFGCDLVLKIHKPTPDEISLLKPKSVLACLLEPYHSDGTLEKLASQGVSALAMELIPRTTRAQSMDVLSSQANIAGYRAVVEAANHYGRFFGMMMTSAGMAKPAKLVVLGAGVAGLQAIATAKRLGAQVEAFDVRPEVKEQILSLGAKFIEIDIGEAGSGTGGYAKELSEEGKRRQIAGLTEKIKKTDIVVSTANIPGRKSPLLITEEAVKGMRTGSVIIDMAAANGGNCALSEPDKVVKKFGVTIVGLTNYPSLMPADSSNFFGNNLINLISLILESKDGKTDLKWNLEDDIIAASLVSHEGKLRWSKK